MIKNTRPSGPEFPVENKTVFHHCPYAESEDCLALKSSIKWLKKARKIATNKPNTAPVVIIFTLSGSNGFSEGMLGRLIMAGSRFILDKSTPDNSAIFNSKLVSCQY
jgi:hypothetical protein